jgi:hypothetical protein
MAGGEIVGRLLMVAFRRSSGGGVDWRSHRRRAAFFELDGRIRVLPHRVPPRPAKLCDVSK